VELLLLLVGEGRHIMGEQHDVGAQLTKQQGLVHRPRPGAEDADWLVADLPAVAVGAVQHRRPPALGQARKLGQLVGQSGGDQQPPSCDVTPVRELRHELARTPLHCFNEPALDAYAVLVDLTAPDRQQLARRRTLSAQVVVDVTSRGIARLAGIDHQHRPPRPSQRQRTCEARGPAADHQYVVRRVVHDGSLRPRHLEGNAPCRRGALAAVIQWVGARRGGAEEIVALVGGLRTALRSR
jgi:hypothetical protein